MVGVFFGHRDAPSVIYGDLVCTVRQLVQQGVDTFYMGNNGSFDRMAMRAVRQVGDEFAHIRYAVVLAYLQTDPCEEPTVYPEGLEGVPRRFAIDRRNGWMVAQADWVIGYVTVGYGGAAKFLERARRQGKRVINLGEGYGVQVK